MEVIVVYKYLIISLISGFLKDWIFIACKIMIDSLCENSNLDPIVRSRLKYNWQVQLSSIKVISFSEPFILKELVKWNSAAVHKVDADVFFGSATIFQPNSEPFYTKLSQSFCFS